MSFLTKLAPYKVPVKKTLDCALAWTNAILPEEETIDDKVLGMLEQIVDEIIPDPPQPDI